MNAFVLMTVGLWGYMASETPSLTALIPVFAGALLLTFVEKLRYGSKSFFRFSLILTALILIALIKPLIGALSRADSGAIYQIGFMMISCTITMGFFVRKFIKVNKKRAKVNG